MKALIRRPYLPTVESRRWVRQNVVVQTVGIVEVGSISAVLVVRNLSTWQKVVDLLKESYNSIVGQILSRIPLDEVWGWIEGIVSGIIGSVQGFKLRRNY